MKKDIIGLVGLVVLIISISFLSGYLLSQYLNGDENSDYQDILIDEKIEEENYKLTITVENSNDDYYDVEIYIDDVLKNIYRVEDGETVSEVFTVLPGYHEVEIYYYYQAMQTQEVWMDFDKTLTFIV